MLIGELIAKSKGLKLTGDHQCFYCGLPADREFTTSSLFVGWRDVAQRYSRYRCAACEASQSESMDMPGYEKKQKARTFSWVITQGAMESYSKAHIGILRNYILNPPEPPYGICIAKSGQKVILYKTPVVTDPRWPAVQFEDMTIRYTVAGITPLFHAATYIVAVLGKPSLTDVVTPAMASKLFEQYGEDTAASLLEWFVHSDEPLYQLVSFLAHSKEESCLKLLTQNDSDANSQGSATSPVMNLNSQRAAKPTQRTLWS